jgi:hypothetical protein
MWTSPFDLAVGKRISKRREKNRLGFPVLGCRAFEIPRKTTVFAITSGYLGTISVGTFAKNIGGHQHRS